MTYSDYIILQEDFSNYLYQNKFGDCVNTREEAFDEAILACKSILHRNKESNFSNKFSEAEFKMLDELFEHKRVHVPMKRTSRAEAYNNAIDICRTILKEHFKKWGLQNENDC